MGKHKTRARRRAPPLTQSTYYTKLHSLLATNHARVNTLMNYSFTALIAALITLLAVTRVTADARPPPLVTSDTWASVVDGSRNVVVVFYDGSSAASVNESAFKQAAAAAAARADVTASRFNCDDDRVHCLKYGVDTTPATRLFRARWSEPHNPRVHKSVVDWLAVALDGKPAAKPADEQPFYAPDSAVVALDPSNFDSTVYAASAAFVEFYAPWCGFCKKLKPDYEALAASYAGDDTTLIASVDCTKYKALCTRFEVTGYPTLKLFTGRDAEPIKHAGARSLDGFKAWIAANRDGAAAPAQPAETAPTGVAARRARRAAAAASAAASAAAAAEPVASSVVELTDDNFDAHVDGKRSVFVKFYAPWCGHCKKMGPAYEDLARALDDRPDILVGHVDCTQNKDLCADFEVRGYPTLKLFHTSPGDADIEQTEFSGDRSAEFMKTWLVNTVGAHTAGGGDEDLADEI